MELDKGGRTNADCNGRDDTTIVDRMKQLQLVQKADWIAIVASILKRKQVRRGSPSNLVSREDYDAWTTMNR